MDKYKKRISDPLKVGPISCPERRYEITTTRRVMPRTAQFSFEDL
jgi:hypothetical protein